DLPSIVSKPDAHTHGPGSDDPPLAFSDVRNLHHLAIDQRCDGANSDRVADTIDVSTKRRFAIVNIFGRAKHLEIETGTPFSIKVDRVAPIKVNTPRRAFGLPSQAVELHRKLSRRACGIVAAQTLHCCRVAVSDGYYARLLWL